MSCSVFKWGAGWRKGICYLGASWVYGGENIACYMFFLSVFLLLFSFPFAVQLNSFHHNSQVLPFGQQRMVLVKINPIPDEPRTKRNQNFLASILEKVWLAIPASFLNTNLIQYLSSQNRFSPQNSRNPLQTATYSRAIYSLSKAWVQEKRRLTSLKT